MLICDKASSSYPSSVCYFPNRNGQGWVPLKQEGKFLWHRSALNVKQTMTIAVTSKLSLCGSHSSHVVTMGWVHKETVINFIEPKSGEESKPELEGNWSLVQLPFPHSTHTSQLCCVGCDGKTSLSFWEKYLLSVFEICREAYQFLSLVAFWQHAKATHPISQSFSGAIT